MTWSAEELAHLDAADELEITVGRRPVPIWVVSAGGDVYVRTWHRRDTGWFGAALKSRRAHIRVPGLETDVTVDDVGTDQRAAVDAAYQAK